MLLENLRQAYLPPTNWPQPTLSEELCDGCGRCVKTCPMQILELRDGLPAFTGRYDEFRCVLCDSCLAVCPKGAIKSVGVYRVHSGRYKNEDIFPSSEATYPRPFGDATPERFADFEEKLTETERVIFKRRSVRLFKKQQVPRELVERIIEAGRFAPSAGNNQPWKFTVVQDGELLQEICKKTELIARPLAKLAFPNSSEEFERRPWRQKAFATVFSYRKPGEGDQRVAVGVKAITEVPYHEVFLGAPTVIMVLCDRRGIGNVDLDTALAVENIVIAAHSLGLGTCIIGLLNLPLLFFPGMRRKLGIVHPFKLLTAISVGFPLGVCDRAVRREPARIDWL